LLAAGGKWERKKEAKVYGSPMEGVWNPYGTPMEHHAYNKLAIGLQHACGWLGIPDWKQARIGRIRFRVAADLRATTERVSSPAVSGKRIAVAGGIWNRLANR
jgi:NDP-sugar pyrophosphorylase family protein